MTLRRIKLVAAVLSLLMAASMAASHSSAYQSAERKIHFLQDNGERQPPEPATTTLTAAEINAYLAEGGVALPVGVQRVHFSSVPVVVTAAARVDFDKLTAGRPMNPFMAVFFTGVHDVAVEAQASGSNGTGSVRVESVSIDGVKVPRAALQFLVDHYLKPKYGPAVGLDSSFRLPARIHAAVVGQNQLSLTQR